MNEIMIGIIGIIVIATLFQKDLVKLINGITGKNIYCPNCTCTKCQATKQLEKLQNENKNRKTA